MKEEGYLIIYKKLKLTLHLAASDWRDVLPYGLEIELLGVCSWEIKEQ